jgi:hypothetical protein
MNKIMAPLDPYQQFIVDIFFRKHNDIPPSKDTYIREYVYNHVFDYSTRNYFNTLRMPLRKENVSLDIINAHNASLRDFVFINHLHENYGLCDEDLIVAKKIAESHIASEKKFLINLGVKIYMHIIGMYIVDLEFILENFSNWLDIKNMMYHSNITIQSYLLKKQKACQTKYNNIPQPVGVSLLGQKLIEVQKEIDCFWDFEKKSDGHRINILVPQLRRILCRTSLKGSIDDMNTQVELSFNSGEIFSRGRLGNECAMSSSIDFFYVGQSGSFCSHYNKKRILFAPYHMSPVSLRFFLKKCGYLGGQDVPLKLEPEIEDAPIITIEI